MIARPSLPRSAVGGLGLLALVAVGCSGRTASLSTPAPAVEPVHPHPQSRVGGSPAAAPDQGVRLLVEVGGALPGHPESIVAGLGLPLVDARGTLSFTGTLITDGPAETATEGFVWQDGRIRLRNSEVESSRLLGAAPQIAADGVGRFAFRTQVDGEEGLWSDRGLVMRQGSAAPGFGPESKVRMVRRPRMLADGALLWLAEVREARGPRGRSRALFRRPAGPDDVTEVLLRSDDPVGAFRLARPDGLELAFAVAPAGSHRALVVNVLDGGGEKLQGVLVDDDLPVLQHSSIGGPDGERWERFHRVAVDDNGNWLLAADTDADPGRDMVAVYNGVVLHREGDLVDGFDLRPPARPLAVALSAGSSLQAWSVGGVGEEIIVFNCEPSSPDRARVVLETRTAIDLDGDGAPDGRVERLSDLGHGNPLAGRAERQLYLAVQWARTGEEMHEAIVVVPLPPCRDPDSAAAAGAGMSPGVGE